MSNAGESPNLIPLNCHVIISSDLTDLSCSLFQPLLGLSENSARSIWKELGSLGR